MPESIGVGPDRAVQPHPHSFFFLTRRVISGDLIRLIWVQTNGGTGAKRADRGRAKK